VAVCLVLLKTAFQYQTCGYKDVVADIHAHLLIHKGAQFVAQFLLDKASDTFFARF
jgi:hypothetical protein